MSSDHQTIRVALVTGSAQGIGRAIAIRFASEGLDVAIDDLPSKSELLQDVVGEIEKLGRKALPLTFDVTREEEVNQMVGKTVSELGRLDVMVANAGISGRVGTILEADLANWKLVWDVNSIGTLLCYKYAALQMVKQGSGGRIIGASSICGKRGFSKVGAYCTSKAMVRSLTQTAALELAEYGITVNAYAPGLIETEMTDPPDSTRRLLDLPQAKSAKPDVVASMVSYLASTEAHFITGQTISVDGGILFD